MIFSVVLYGKYYNRVGCSGVGSYVVDFNVLFKEEGKNVKICFYKRNIFRNNIGMDIKEK